VRITITTRHCEISDELRARARTLVERLGKVASRAQDAHVIFGQDHAAPTVELKLHRSRGKIHIGTGSAVDHRSALDRAVQKVRRQLDKPPARRARAATRKAR